MKRLLAIGVVALVALTGCSLEPRPLNDPSIDYGFSFSYMEDLPSGIEWARGLTTETPELAAEFIKGLPVFIDEVEEADLSPAVEEQAYVALSELQLAAFGEPENVTDLLPELNEVLDALETDAEARAAR
ncbi:hypothetical protein EYE40_09550 [Glaciihabitans arcticus]|uniref:Uncharacterized protein n=1 Tax=Glaciihabitans arcticus TaxID=2668039 RepID=A0A4Q9GZ30_9MICO|nr:hypothetical protein [Glaciihabitans arcticus]TBN57610.1 hypothetical protein EYE40_09550 [Glaciihabitans arcticus]